MAIRGEVIVETHAAVKHFDNDYEYYGTGKDVAVGYDQSDANANVFKTDFLAGGSAHVPVHVYGVDIADRDLGFFNGTTEPVVAVVDLARTSWISIGFQAAGEPAIQIGGSATTLYLPTVQVTQVTIYSAENLFYLTESDQTDPAGRYRFRLNGDVLYLEDATTASWAADNDLQTWAAGGIVINAAGADINFQVKGNANDNMIVVDAGLDTMGLGAAVQTDTRLYIGFGTLTVTADANGEFIDINPALTEAGGGTHAIMAGVNIQALTLTAGVGATTVAATLRIANAPSGGGSNYAFWVAAGQTELDGAVVVGTTNGIDYTPGSDTDVDLITVTVTGTPILSWDESDDRFTFSKGVDIDATVGYDVTPGSDTDADLITVNVTGTPRLWWDESEDCFVLTKGLILAAGTAGSATEVYLVNDNAGDLTLNALSSKTINFAIAGTDEFRVDGNGLVAVDAAGPAVVNEAATTTNPTLIPNQAELDTGIGWASDVIHIVLGGASEYSFSTTALEMNDNHLDNCGYIVLNAITWVTGETGMWNETAGELHLNAVTGKTIVLEIADVAEYTFSATILDMNDNALDNCGYVILNAATSPAATEAHLTNITNNIMLNATTGNQINLAVANTSILRVYSDRVFFFQDIFTDRWQWINSNTFVGSGVANGGGLTAAGTHNTGYGYVAFTGITSASFTTAIGSRVLVSLTSGDANTTVGYYGLRLVSTGAGNTSLGYQAGDNITTGSYNTIIGYDVDAPSATANYQIEIGDGTNQGRLRNDNAGDWTIYSPSGKVIKLQPDGDVDDYVTLDTLSGVPTWYATGSYMRFGDAQTTQVSLASEDDVMVSGKLEVYGITYHTGVVFVGGTDVTADAIAGPTIGIHINQAANDDAVLVFQSSDVAHGATTLADTDTYAIFKKSNSDAGGLSIEAYRDADAANGYAFYVSASLAENVDTTKSTSGTALIYLLGRQLSGTGQADVVADGNILAVAARISNVNTTVMIVDEDGDLWLNGGITATTITTSGILSQDDTTNSTSGVTGSIHTDGGIGIAEDLYCAKAINTPDGMGADGEQLTSGGDSVAMDWAAAGSLAAFKEIHRELAPQDALDTILGTTVYLFHYREEMKGGGHPITTGDFDTLYAGVLGEDAPWAMHYNGKIFSPVSAFGYTVAAFQAIDNKVEGIADRVLRLEQELAEAKAELAEIRGGN